MVNNLKHYLLLMALLSIGFGGLWFFNFNREMQIILVSILCLSYFLWGIIYHFLRRELNRQLVFEYFVISLAAGLVIIFLLLRA